MTPKKATSPKHIKDLISDPENRRKHTPRNVGLIVDALQKVGAARSLVIDEDNQVLAGNATLEAAAEAGITKVKVVDADGSEVVAVRRTGLSADQKRDLAIYDNRAAELAQWNMDQLVKDASDGIDLTTFFNKSEFDELLATLVPNEDLNMEPPGADVDGASTVGGMLNPSNVSMVQLFLTVETAPQFKEWLRTLAKAYSTSTVSETVFRAVKEEAEKH